MVARLLDEIGANPPKDCGALMKLLELAAQPDSYREFVNRNSSGLPNFEARKSLLEMGHFQSQDFLHLLYACGDGEGISSAVVMPLLRRLIEWGLVVDHTMFGSHAYVNYSWEQGRIGVFNDLRVVDNILFGASYVARKYRSSVPAVYVRRGEDEYTGTGFLVTNRVDRRKCVIVTAKHNVDPEDGITFIGLNEPNGSTFNPVSGNWILHPKLDLALLEVECNDAIAPIFPVGYPLVLTRTITLGYPRIATTDSSYLLAHSGELNAIVNTYHGEDRLIISNVVAPGNSGGPVLDEAGLCLGVIVNSFETQHEGGVEKANSAIPAKHVLEFIGPYCS
ncbi:MULTISPECIES: S1 family peptidase [unclassified Rhizobium]|uniref:S1 family peptidase n=1 Tax=unclassified Rhizobium TaxID=2613769 RepID=UPI00177D1D54|nr:MULTISPECIES: serine protease [unclassified Rhizobium]MBD8686489.1 trypsin-like peptidase domain-containing protein [Rhizobium sp. CFBP 13644]MBD8693746.1 trypsin-like peptidase domain-containing protein [Rhizobium sp. CFBP 13717]